MDYTYTHSSSSGRQPMCTPQPHTSSAFSACANPNEDWTKISDLAERRRIQNRIAQRNYRKKLKRRLEDLERRAGSSSASPEQKPQELDLSSCAALTAGPADHRATPSSRAIANNRTNHKRSPSGKGRPANISSSTPSVASTSTSPALLDDRSMFSQQHIRQLSASPPLFSAPAFSALDIAAASSANYTHSGPYLSPPYMTTEFAPAYVPSVAQDYSQAWQGKLAPIKQEGFGDDEMNPFSMSYASMAGGVDLSCTGSDLMGPTFQDPSMMSTPELLADMWELSSAGSPGDMTGAFPLTPMAMPLTPPLTNYEQA